MSKEKCDCCGKLVPVSEIQVVSFPEKEFDGAACDECIKNLSNCSVCKSDNIDTSKHMWRKYEDEKSGDYGFVKLISDDYTVWRDNAEVILVDHFPMAKDGEVKVLVTRSEIRFTEFGSEEEQGFQELKDDYFDHYGKEPTDITDLAFYCADGWSRWNAVGRIENPTEEELKSYLKSHGIEV